MLDESEALLVPTRGRAALLAAAAAAAAATPIAGRTAGTVLATVVAAGLAVTHVDGKRGVRELVEPSKTCGGVDRIAQQVVWVQTDLPGQPVLTILPKKKNRLKQKAAPKGSICPIFTGQLAAIDTRRGMLGLTAPC